MRGSIGAVLTAIAALTITACSGSSGSTAGTAPIRSASSSALPSKSASSGPLPSKSASSSAPPLRSDVAACREFGSWYRQFGPHDSLADTSKMVILQIAVSEAPSGQLHHDLAVLESDVIAGAKATGSLKRLKEQTTVSAARRVAQGCQSANVNS
jgi:hypothetical protein